MTSKYENLSKEELIKIISRRDAERPLGLVWERNEIGQEDALNDDFVVLENDPSLSYGEEPWENLIIEGDNFDALRYLKMTHKGKVKVIFIDPPYNTGNKDFIYNDQYLNKDDEYKHSKWIEFMYQRLLIARELLTDDGVMFINIGDQELAHLSLLMEKVFPGKKVGTFVWRKRVGATDEAGYNVSMDHDYILCYGNKEFSFAGSSKDLEKYANPDNDPRGPWMSADLSKGHNRLQRPNTYYPIQDPKTGYWYPCSPGNVWRFSSEDRIKPGQKLRSPTMEEQIKNEKVLFPDSGYVTFETVKELRNGIRSGEAPDVLTEELPDLDFFVGKKIGYGRPRYKRHLSEMKRTTKPISTFIGNVNDKVPTDAQVEFLKSGLNTEGTTLLKNILGEKKFDYPKPLSLIKDILRQVTSPDGNDIVLDFFAGSGTTAHAVLALNDEDKGGNRKFILVSNKETTKEDAEKNVCRDVTRIRMQRVIEGYEYRYRKKHYNVEGMDGDFAYMIAKRIPKANINFKVKHKQVWIALQMIHQFPISQYRDEDQVKYNFLEDVLLGYVQKVDEYSLEEIQSLTEKYSSVVIYSWEPGYIKQSILQNNLTVHKIPDFLVKRFGEKL